MSLVTLMRAFGILLIIGGVATLGGVVPILEPASLQALVAALSVIVAVFGFLWYRKVTEAAERAGLLGKKRSSRRAYLLIFLAVLSTLAALAPVYGMADICDTTTCPQYRTRVLTIEYFILSLTLIAGLLAFGPILFGRTILGPIFQELQYMAGAMFMILLVFMLILFPVHVIFVPCGEGGSGCYIDPCQLMYNGPPLLRFLIRMIMPPGYGC